MARSTLQNAGFMFSGQLVSRLVALGYFASLARALGPSLYGALGLGTSLGAIFAVILEPGLNSLLIRDVARAPEILASRFAESLGYKLVTLGFAWLLALATGLLLGYRGDTLWAVLWAGGSVLLVAFEDLCAAALISRERMDLEGALRISSKLIIATAGFLALAMRAPFQGVLASMTIGGVLVALTGLLFVRRTGIRVRATFHPRRAWALVAPAWPLAITGVLWLITLRIDQVLASQLGVPTEDIGNYNAVVKVVESLVFVPNAIAVVFQPILARTWAEGPERCSKELSLGLETSLSLTLPVALGGAVLSSSLTSMIYGARFTSAGPLLMLQLLALPLIAVQFTAFNALIAAGALRVQTGMIAVNMIVNVCANLLLVPRFGIMGATWAALLGGAVATVSCLFALRSIGLSSGLSRTLWRPLASTLVMSMLVWGLRDRVPFVVSIGVGAVAYGVCFAGLGGWRLLGTLRAARAATAPAME
jgi:O-antigen/teichoic acid export membrane protein